MAVPDMSPAAIAARLAAAPANGSTYTYQDYLNAGNDPTANQGQGANNYATSVLMGNPQYQQLLRQAKAGDPSAQAQLQPMAQQIMQQHGMDPSQAKLSMSDPNSATYGYGQDMGTGYDWKLAAAILGGGFLAGGLTDGFGSLIGDTGAPAATAATTGSTVAATGAPSSEAISAVSGYAGPGASSLGTGAGGAGAAAGGGGAAAATKGVDWSKFVGPGFQTAGALISGHEQAANQAAQLKNQQLGQALGATQTNPYAQLQDSQRQALAQMLVSNYTPQTYTPGHASTGAGDPTTPGSFSGGLYNAMQHLNDPSVSQLFGQPAMNAAASNFNAVASNNPFYHNQLQGVPGFNFSTNATAGQTSGLGTNPSQGVTGKPSPAGINTGQGGQASMPINAIPGYSTSPTTPSSLQSLSKSLANSQQPSYLPFGNTGSF